MTRQPKQGEKTLYLIDGSSYIYRAYHAIRGLATRDGVPTNAIYGFANMLLKILRDHHPSHLAVVLDSPGPTFRHEQYPDYKANRPPMPDDLSEQMAGIEELITAFRIPALRMEGVEADDIIATLVDRFSTDVDGTVIVSSDKDLMQLVSDRVSMLDTMKDRWFGVEEVTERFGVEPEHVVDVLALMGDSSDNIPGVAGIGPKTAGKLIAQYGDLESLLRQAPSLGGKVGQRLTEGADEARQALSLVTLVRDLDVSAGLEDLAATEPDTDNLRRLFKELEFTRLLAELVPASSLSREGYRVILDEDEVVGLARTLEAAGRFAVDVETDSKDPMRASLVGISFSWQPGQAAYVPLAHSYLGAPQQIPLATARDVLGPVLSDPSKEKIGQNIKYDLEVLTRAGWPMEGIACDTMVASYLANPGRRTHNLADIAAERLNHSMISYTDVTGKGKNQVLFSQVDVERAAEYSAEDADVTFRIAAPLLQDLDSLGLTDLFTEVEMPLVSVLADMEMSGVAVDTGQLVELSAEVQGRLKDLESRIHQDAGRSFNINSPRQLAQVLFEDLGLPPLKRTKTGFSTNGDVLLELSSKHHLPAMVLDYRSLSKLKSTYMDALPALIHPDTGRIHTSFNQTATATGRLSSSDPNLQNIPIRTDLGKRIREAFVAGEGRSLVSADYSQIELRILAHLSGDAHLVEAFSRGEDIHSLTARQVLGAGEPVEPELRRRAKVINFGIIYGMSAFGLSKELGVHPREAGEIIEGYFQAYDGVRSFIDATLDRARQDGYVTTMMGRRRSIPELASSNPAQRQLGERMAINTPVQGTAADLIKVAMIRIHHRLAEEVPAAAMILQVHDELVFEVPQEDVGRTIPVIREEMESVAQLTVPLVVDVGTGPNWAEAH